MITIKRSRDFFLAIILLASLSFSTVVYSAFNTQLQISGEAMVRAEQMIRVTGIRLIEKTNNAFEVYNSKYEKDTTSLYVSLPASSSMTYEVTVTNKSSQLIYYLAEILPLITDNSNVTVAYSIKAGDCINSNENHKFTITLTNSTASEQVLTLINQYRFEPANWNPLETTFLSAYDSGDLGINPDGVIFEFSVTNPNAFSATYSLTSDNFRFKVVDDVTRNNTFQIEPGATITHKALITLRSDVVCERYTENVKLMIKTTLPLVSNVDVKTVELNLPRHFQTIVLNSMPIQASPKHFTSMENTNGYLLRVNEMTSSSYTYYYRGVINNNYVSFAGNLWRVVRINTNGDIKLVLNDNVATTAQYSKNYSPGSVQNIEAALSLVDYKNSAVRTAVETWYNENIVPNAESKYVVNSKFCIDLGYQAPIETSYDHTVYYFTPYLHVGADAHSFTPDFSCAVENIFTSPVGLLTAEEVLAAGGYWEQHNSSYYLYNPNIAESQTSWTLSSSYYSISEKQAGVIVFNQDEKSLFDWISGGNIAQSYGYRPVITIDGNVNVVGDGTIDNPYKIVG